MGGNRVKNFQDGAMGRGKADTRHDAPYLNDIDLGGLSESKSPSNKSNPRVSAGKMGGIVPHDHWDKAQVWTHLGRDIQAKIDAVWKGRTGQTLAHHAPIRLDTLSTLAFYLDLAPFVWSFPPTHAYSKQLTGLFRSKMKSFLFYMA